MNATFVFNGRSIAYTNEGAGDALLFIHEWNSSSLTFAKVNLPILAKQYRVIAFDLPGFGKSEAIEDFELSMVPEIISSLMDHLGIAKFHIMGFCLGAAIAVDYYLLNPQRVESLILIETALSIPLSLKFVSLPLIGRFFYHTFSKTSAGFKITMQFLNNRVLADNDDFVAVFRQSTYSNAIVYLKLLRKRLSAFHKQIRKSPTTSPCLIITSQNTLRLFYRDSLQMHNLLKGSKLIIMENSGHYIHVAKPKTLCKHVHEFICNQA